MKWVGLFVGIIIGLVLLNGFAVAQGGRDYHVEAEVDNETPFVGQRIVYTLRFFAAADVALPVQTRYQPSSFEGFWYGGELAEQQTVQQRDGRQYVIREIRTVLYPLRAGSISISSAGIVFPATVFRGEETLAADPLLVNAQPLPEGAPEGYNGAVGQFDMVVTIDRNEMAQGEPITLNLVVTGTGNVEQLLPPQLNLPQNWRVYVESPVYRPLDDTVTLAEKVFSWQIVPAESGEQLLPSVTLHFFDPVSRAYRFISTAPVPLKIIPANPVTGGSSSSESAAVSTGLHPLKPVPASVDGPLSGRDNGVWLYPLFGLPLLSILAVLGWYHRQRWLAQNRLRLQQARALGKAVRDLQSARKLPSEQACGVVSAVVLDYLFDKTGVPVLGKGHSELRGVMQMSSVSNMAADRLIACLERAEAGRFAPLETGSAQGVVTNTVEALTAVDNEWRSG